VIFQDPMTAFVKITMSWGMKLCSSVDRYPSVKLYGITIQSSDVGKLVWNMLYILEL
jgi:hypothetical protein